MTPEEILNRFAGLNVLVVGDICLDRWCFYEPSAGEPSRETGISRVGVVRFESTAGASGTIANNLADLGVGKVSVMGVIGDDSHGDDLFRALNTRDIGVDLVVRSGLVQTFTYTKHINQQTGKEDLPRVDYINNSPLPAAIEDQLVASFDSFAPYFDALLICDQAETEHGGAITEALRERIVSLAKESPGKIVWVDSRRRPELFEHCFLKPNEQEAKEAGIRISGSPDYSVLARTLSLRALVVTQGERGATVVDGRGVRTIAAPIVALTVDICGAGDSFSAGTASALASGASLDEAVHFGNLVASVTVTKLGTGTAFPAEVLEAQRRWTDSQ